jgi:hypothetical protein
MESGNGETAGLGRVWEPKEEVGGTRGRSAKALWTQNDSSCMRAQACGAPTLGYERKRAAAWVPSIGGRSGMDQEGGERKGAGMQQIYAPHYKDSTCSFIPPYLHNSEAR